MRALEKGFTGGVYQSRSNTPNTSRRGSMLDVNPKPLRIPYGKANLSGSTIALDMGASSNSLGKGPEVRSGTPSGTAGTPGTPMRRASGSLVDGSVSSSRSNSPEVNTYSGYSSRSPSPGQPLRSTQFSHDDDISEMNSMRPLSGQLTRGPTIAVYGPENTGRYP